MPGTKSNTITYVFEGETLYLEQAIKRVQSLMRGTVKTLKEQDGGITEVQKNQYKQLRSLMKNIKLFNTMGRKLSDSEQAQLHASMKHALTLANSLYKAKLRVKDRIRKKEFKEEQKVSQKEADMAEELEFAKTPEAQVRAHSQLQQLSRLSGFMNVNDPHEQQAFNNLKDVISEYTEAKRLFDEGTGTMDRLAAATMNLNNEYKDLATSLNRLSSEQNKANHGEGKSSFLGFVLGKTKSLTVYKIIKAILSKISQSIQSAFHKIASISTKFNDSMSRLISSLTLVADKVATVIAPLLQLITPLIEGLADLVGKLADNLAEVFSALSGNDVWTKATKQVKDYSKAVEQASQPKGVDELNKLGEGNNMVEVAVDDKFANLKTLGNEIQQIFAMVFNTVGPALDHVVSILSTVFTLIGSIAVALQPLFNLVSGILSILTGALDGVLGVLINGILVPIISVLATIISHMEILIPLVVALMALFAATHWATFVGTLKLIWTNFLTLGKSILVAAKDLVVWIAQAVAARVKSIALAIANTWEAMTWWQKAIAIIAAGGVLAAVIAGIVITATASANSAAQSNLNDNMGVTAAMATGGIVAAPTLALVGEGQYPEAVVPLGQSPQFKSMKQGIAEEVVGMLGGNNSNNSNYNNRPVVLNIDGKTLARALWPELVSTQYQVGVKLK